MRVLSAEAIAEWFAHFPSRGAEYVHYDAGELFFTHPEANCIDTQYPTKLERLPFLARYLATLGYDDCDFRGALLWFANWGLRNQLDEAPGYHIIEAMHRAVGQPTAFEIAPGHQFRVEELQDAVAMLLQPMVFGWDANYLPLWSYGTDQLFLHISHDSFVTVVTRTKEFYDKSLRLLRECELNPVTSPEPRVRRFCHQ